MKINIQPKRISKITPTGTVVGHIYKDDNGFLFKRTALPSNILLPLSGIPFEYLGVENGRAEHIKTTRPTHIGHIILLHINTALEPLGEAVISLSND